MKNGVKPIKIDHRNYSTHTFGTTFAFATEVNLDAGFGFPNQNADGLPEGCTGYSQSELCQDQDKARYKPKFTYEKTLFMMNAKEGEPCDMPTSLKSTKVYGVQSINETTDAEASKHLRGAYYQVEKVGDWFDGIRSAISQNNCSVSVATQWYESFGNPTHGIISDTPAGNFSWHNYKISGWKVINGETYLIAKSWQGANYGDNGYCYFSRTLINKLLSVSGAGAFIVAPYDPSKLKTVELGIFQTILSYFVRWLESIKKKPVESAPIVDHYQEVKEAIQPPKYLWDTVDNIRHSLRVIGDEFSLTVLQKDLLCDICSCESGFNVHAKLVNSPTSIDRGLFQWNNKYHPEITDEIAYDPEKTTRLACKAILNKQVHTFWSASEHCWNKTHKYDSLLT